MSIFKYKDVMSSNCPRDGGFVEAGINPGIKRMTALKYAVKTVRTREPCRMIPSQFSFP